MSKAIVLISLFLIAGIASATHMETFNALWQAWKLKHNKSYGLGEETARFGIFIENVKKITQHNQENSEVKLALNKFADLTKSEFKAIYASGNKAQVNPEAQKNHVSYNLRDLPDEVDWRGKGAVTPVKDQGQCGSCWAFSATGVIEGFYYINHGQLLSFSEQQILDCDVGGEDQACNGGWHYLAVEYAGKNGLETEKDYPYHASKGKCKFDATKATKTNTGYAYVKANSTVDLKTALVAGPVSVAIEADEDVFQFYNRGVISFGCGADIDHAVLAVGYQKVGKLDAFIVKNSWGKSWGDKGYVLLSTVQTLNKGRGACGILSIPVIVT